MKVASVVALASIAGASAYTSYNQPIDQPGNENFPTSSVSGGFQPELEKNLPTINVKYRHPISKMDMSKVLAEAEEDAAFDAALQDAYLQFSSDAADLKMASGNKRYSFLKQDPFAAAIAGAKVGAAAPSPYEATSELFQGMKFSARPAHRASAGLIDPAAFETVSSCDRDYSSGVCPSGFASEGGACVATAAYRGPCASEAHDFSTMSSAAKARWQSQCESFFPCKSCTRDYSQTCPMGWTSDASGSCSPGASYTGTCGTTNFSEYNAAMLKTWSDNCGAQWSCA